MRQTSAPSGRSDASPGGRRRRRPARVRWFPVLTAVAVVVALLATPSSALRTAPLSRAASDGGLSSAALEKLSSGVLQRYLTMHPEQAPEELRSLLDSPASADAGRVGTAAILDGVGARFNEDVAGLPQNEESVTSCPNRQNVVLGGTNDYRGLLSPRGNFTGWHLSIDGGQSVTNEGLLPPVPIGGEATPSGGDPVNAATGACALYGASLNYPLDLDFGNLAPSTNGVGVYRTTPQRLANCPGGEHSSCWPSRRAVATNRAGHFLDKEWMAVGRSGDAGTVVWVVYTDFDFDNPDFPGLFTNQIKAVRCDRLLRECTRPMLISGQQNSLQFGDVTVGPDGRTYITWEEDNDLANNFEPPERMKFWMRVAPPGSTDFGPARLVARAPLNLGIAGLHANDLRASTYPKNTVAMVGGRPKVFVTWEECEVRTVGDSVCVEPQVKIRSSDDRGATWGPTRVVSEAGDNYFPTIDTDASTGRVMVAYHTTRYDPQFHNRYDIELATVSARTGQVLDRQRLTQVSNDPEADPLLGGAFIGDYIEVYAEAGRTLVHYNANYMSIPTVGEGPPIPQQDNFLLVVQ